MMDLGNIPRLYTALAEWLSCMLLLSGLPKRFSGWRRRCLEGGFLAALCLFLEGTGGLDVVWFLPCIIGAALMMFAFLALCGDISLWSALYCCAGAFILAEFAASLEWQLYYYTAYRMGGTGPLVRGLFLAGTYLLVFGGAWLWLRKRRAGELARHAARATPREAAAALAIGVGIYALSNLSYVSSDTPFSGQYTHDIFNIRTLVDLCGVAILYAHHVQGAEVYALREKDALRSVLQAQYTQYQQSQESIELINRKYHDLKHQIAVLRAESDSEKKNAYLDRMEAELRAYEAQNKTGNQVLDTVLTGKSLTCQQRGIRLTCVADGAALDFLDEMDLCTLFGNALDNAIESVERLPDLDRRLIHLTVARQKGFVQIRVENTFEGTLRFEGDLPVTTKEDKRSHGYGLKSIRATAEKYGGSVTISTRENWFELRVLFPLEH